MNVKNAIKSIRENPMPWALFVVAVIVMVWTGWLASDRALTTAEAVALQVIPFVSSVAGAYLIGQDHAFASRVRPAARSAFRRLKSLYAGLSRIAHIVESDQIGEDSNKIAVIREVTVLHLLTSDDALQDWSDLDPEGVSELRTAIKQRAGGTDDA